MSIKLGDTAPNFQAESSAGDINFYDIWRFLGNLVFASCRLYTGMYYRTWIYFKTESLNLIKEEPK
jgi:hypothetical protein